MKNFDSSYGFFFTTCVFGSFYIIKIYETDFKASVG